VRSYDDHIEPRALPVPHGTARDREPGVRPEAGGDKDSGGGAGWGCRTGECNDLVKRLFVPQ